MRAAPRAPLYCTPRFTPGAAKHPVFGRVLSGFEVVDALGAVAVDGDERPLDPVRIARVGVRFPAEEPAPAPAPGEKGRRRNFNLVD